MNWLNWWPNWSILLLFNTKFSTGSLSREQATPIFVVFVPLLNHVCLFVTLWTEAFQASLSLTISQRLLKLMSIELVMPSNHLVLCHPLFLLPSIFPSIRVFSSESALCIRWPKYWSSNLIIIPSNECSGFISFIIDWERVNPQMIDPLPIHRILKSLLQHHSSKTSILPCLTFFLYSPTLISILDYWKNHSFDYMDLCWQGNISAF